MHAEMPNKNPDGSPNVGLQLWVDLPRKLKMCEPRYRDLRAAEIPSVTSEDGRVAVKIISGTSHGVESLKDLAYTPVWLLDVTIQPGGHLEQPLPIGWNAFAYTIEGKALFGDKLVDQFHNVVFEREGDGVDVRVADNAEKPARFVIVAGVVLDQPIVQYGPFVLNSNDEVYQAVRFPFFFFITLARCRLQSRGLTDVVRGRWRTTRATTTASSAPETGSRRLASAC